MHPVPLVVCAGALAVHTMAVMQVSIVDARTLSLTAMPIETLAANCERETQHYRRGIDSDTRYCLEIFRRALRAAAAQPAPESSVSPGDDRAWEVLVRLYTPFVHAQINRRSVTWCAADDVAQQVWLRIYSAARSGLEFPSLAQGLSYLKRATVSVLIELARQEARRAYEQPLTTEGDDAEDRLRSAEPGPYEIHLRKAFFARCQVMISDAVEWRIFMLRYGLGYQPQIIAARFNAENVLLGGRLATARRVSDVLERCIRRLTADPEIRDLLSSE